VSIALASSAVLSSLMNLDLQEPCWQK
jgi:hypothetical protein